MADESLRVPQFTIAPPMRCFFKSANRPGLPCGALAQWKRPGNHWFADEFYCDKHRASSDVTIPTSRIFRRLRISCDVLVACCDVREPHARTEAVTRLEQLLSEAGFVVEVAGVRSTFGRFAGSPALGKPNGDAG